MASKRVCDRCGSEIKNISHFADLSTYRYEGQLKHELCEVCAYHLGRWLDGKEKMVGEVNSDA